MLLARIHTSRSCLSVLWTQVDECGPRCALLHAVPGVCQASDAWSAICRTNLNGHLTSPFGIPPMQRRSSGTIRVLQSPKARVDTYQLPRGSICRQFPIEKELPRHGLQVKPENRSTPTIPSRRCRDIDQTLSIWAVVLIGVNPKRMNACSRTAENGGLTPLDFRVVEYM